MSTSWTTFFLGLAEYISTKSKDPSTKTGAVIVRPDRTIVSVGYNGFPKWMPDLEENYANREEKLSRIIHCEMNALLHTKEDLKGCTLYTFPFLSCDRCAVHMIQAGITSMVAPVLLNSKWEETFVRTRKYCKESGVAVYEVGL